MSQVPSAKVSGVGDVPDLISDETPPAAMLEIASDSDVQCASSRKNLLTEGESNEGLNSPEQEKIKLLQSREAPTGAVPTVSSKIKMFEMGNDLNNNVSFFNFSNMGHDDTAEKINENGKMETATEFLALSHAMTTDISEQDKSRAVNAPDAEEQVGVSADGNDDSHEAPFPAAQNGMKTFERTLSPPKEQPTSSHIPAQVHYATSPHSNKTSKNNNEYNGSNGACELLSKKKIHNHCIACTQSPKSIDQQTASSSKAEAKSSFAVRKDSSKGTHLWGESRNPSPSVRRQSGSRSKIRDERSKSPGRCVVQVRDRKESVVLKSTDGKPVSPYLCKVFPVKKDPYPKSGLSFPVNQNQNRLLDEALFRSLERERLLLWNAMHEYFRSKRLPRSDAHPNAAAASVVHPQRDANDGDLNKRETYMSWIINGNHPPDSENEGWNPLANIFRKSRSTQVSQKSSLYDSNQRESSTSPPPLLNSYSHTAFDLTKKIRIVSREQEDVISTSAQSMYHGLKTAQKAIHLSDLFCFRNSVPEAAQPAGESLNQAEFQQFMESGNEIEILVNLMSILGSAKDNIQDYLNSIQEANLVSEKKSGLTKLGIKLEGKDNGDIPSSISLGNHNGEEKVDSLVPMTCPSCQSHISVRRNSQSSTERMLPNVHTFLEEQRNVTLGSYIKKDKGRNRLIQLVMFNGHKYQIKFSSSSLETSNAIQGVMSATTDYVGEPISTTLESLLGTIHRCTSYMDTRMACSCVWSRQSKRFMLEIIEKYLEKELRPSTKLGWWSLRKMEEKLRQFNVFASIIQNFSEELVETIGKLHFCMQKSMELLNTKLRGPKLPGFTEVSLSSDEEDGGSRVAKSGAYQRDADINENGVSSSVELLYNNLKDWLEQDTEVLAGDKISIETLLKIVVLAVKDIDATTALGIAYKASLKMPNKRSRRVLRFMNATSSQLGGSKEVEFGALLATFLSAVDKLNFFDEFMCEQKVDIRAKVNLLCQQIIQKLIDLRCILTMQKGWSINLARNSFMRIKEINEIRRLRKLKKKEKQISEKMRLLRGSDGDGSLMRIVEYIQN